MTTVTLGDGARHVPLSVKKETPEWLRVLGAYAIVTGTMAALTLGEFGVAVLLRWIAGY